MVPGELDGFEARDGPPRGRARVSLVARGALAASAGAAAGGVGFADGFDSEAPTHALAKPLFLRGS